MPITTKVVNLNPIMARYTPQYNINYVIKFVSELQQVGGFLQVLWFPPPIKQANIVESGIKHHKP